jgi:adenylyltransferase/sulfurtransferase
MPAQLSVRDLKALLDRGEPVYLVDVRHPWEHELVALPNTAAVIPLHELVDRHDELAPPPGALVVAYCHHGIRSLNAAALLERIHPRVASLAGGIDRWSLEIDPTLRRY